MEYNLTSWTERDGLRAPRIRALAQTPDGYLWIGTTDGLVRFDGFSFAGWETIGSGDLPRSRVVSLSMHVDGSLWVAFFTGTVARITGLRATVFDVAGAAGAINALVTDRNGAVWIAARTGLLHFDGQQATRTPKSEGLPDGPVINAYQDADGTLWITLNTGIFRRRPGATSFEPVMPASYFDHRITVDRNRGLWITDPRRGFRRMPAIDGQTAAQPSSLAGLGVQILQSKRSGMWVATLGQGVWWIRDEAHLDQIDVLGESEGLLNDVVRVLLEDRDENIWVGTDYGLYRLSRNKLIPIKHLGVARVVQADETGVWVGTSNGLVRFEGTGERVYGQQGELPSPFISALHRDAAGALWVATDHGVAVARNGRFEPFPIQGIERRKRIYSMSVEDVGDLWLADFNRGLFRTTPAGLQPVDVPPLLDHRAVLSVHGDLEGRMWLALSDGRIGFVTRADGALRFTVLAAPPRANARLYAVIQERHGDVWLLTSAGVWHYAEGRIIALDDSNGLPASTVTSAAFDTQGDVWLGTPSGVVRMERDDIAQVSGDPAARVPYGLWDTYDGAAGMPVWLGSPGVSRDPTGRLWFVTSNGISIVDPARLDAATSIPPVLIQSLSVGSTRRPLDGPLKLPPRSSPIEIDYATVMLSAAHKVRFQYRLDNFDDAWTDAGSRRQALFTNLPPGDYTFRVMAVATDGSSSESSATLRFTITPAFTQTSWFYAGLAMLLLLTLWQAWRLRLRYAQRQFALVINERIRMSREIHDTLLQSLIGTALQLEILSTSEAASDETRNTLTRVRRELEDDIRETRQSIWNLRSPRLDRSDLASLVREAGSRITSGVPARLNVTVSGAARRLKPDVEQQLLRIAEQAIVNAVRHASASEVDVGLEFTAGSVRLSVSDNGRGFDPSQTVPDSNLHYGLASMKGRAEEMGARFALRSELGRGTTVETTVEA